MHVKTNKSRVRYAILIPTRGRPEILLKTLKKMPFLLSSRAVVFAIENREKELYQKQCFNLLPCTPKSSIVYLDNSTGSVAISREHLRVFAIRELAATRFVVTDDNAHYSQQSVENLVRAAVEYPDHPVIMAGMHSTAPHFDRHRIADSKVGINGLTSYANVGMIFQVYPRTWFERYSYPADSYGLDDRHFALWLISKGITNFRICMDAPFTKQRYQGMGGQGSTPERAFKCGKGIARLASDFPVMVGATGTLRIPWQLVLDMERGKIPDRLAGGAMRSASALRDVRS